MIKKLRKKFIWIAMCSVVLVLGAIIAVINVINYSKINGYSDKVMSVLIENEGVFPQEIPVRPGKGNDISPETPFEARFFTVLINGEGEAINCNTNKIAAISRETAEEYAKELSSAGKTKGMYDDYKFQAKKTADETLYIFLDCTREMTSFRNFLQASVLISLGGVALVFILVILLSRLALKPVEESYQKQKHFITNVSHDIKTPLTVIGAETEILEMENGESEWTKEIRNQIRRLTSLTDKLVFLSRMEEELKPELKEFDLSETFTETLRPYEACAEAKGLGLLAQCQPGVFYTGNEEMLRQAIALLLDNAVKYTSERGMISATLKRTAKGIELRFRNDAENIKQGDLEELFERFYRIEGSRNSDTGGHGIGLSVVKAIVTAHKGKISAYSADGESIEIVIIL